MRHPAAEKHEMIRLVERSNLPVRRTLRQLGVPPATFYRWVERYQAGGSEALADRSSRPDRVWNRIPDTQRESLIALALAEPELSPRELAVHFTEQHRYFMSEATVYRLLTAQDLITSPAFIVVMAPTNSTPRPPRRTSSGRPTSLTSRSSAGAGSTYPPCSTTSPATSSPGSCVPLWPRVM
jgi:transposase-like protein